MKSLIIHVSQFLLLKRLVEQAATAQHCMVNYLCTVCRSSCLISSWERQWCWAVFTTDMLLGTRSRHILHSRPFQILQYVWQSQSATGFSSVTGTLLCHTSYYTRRLRTSFCDWTAPPSTNCILSVNACNNTMLAWRSSFVMSGEISCSKWPATVQTIHDHEQPCDPTSSPAVNGIQTGPDNIAMSWLTHKITF